MHAEQKDDVGYLGFREAMRYLRGSLASPEDCWYRIRPPWRGMEG